ncbi:tellurite resistance TerB C-terminal domain-containing protein [Apibacter raozihei]|uniref:tellurite resistance TerB C-terminal domain-containing protein n=1 Tax=Apibacter raozihei TaxID=2500547 RepID=UPI000FE29FE4|nr:tellurite resistance TerB C-terminal domain-containing protein [Apibacter raozihei]
MIFLIILFIIVIIVLFKNNASTTKKASSDKLVRRSVNSVENISNEGHSINWQKKIFTHGEILTPRANVPIWGNRYINSYVDLESATTEQKDFYLLFKEGFLYGDYYNLYGNWNYAFILLFDLLNEYKIHKNIQVLENQLNLLGFYYGKTKSYCVSFLIKKLEIIGDYAKINELINEYPSDNYSYENENPSSIYGKKLKLNAKETELLDQLCISKNTFTEIEMCLEETLKLYLLLFKNLNDTSFEGGKNIEQILAEISDLYIKKHYKYKTDSHNYNYAFEDTIKYFHQAIFKICENTVRESYGHKRKLNEDFLLHVPEVNSLYQNKIAPFITDTLSRLIPTILPPDDDTETMLYTMNTTRWKTKFNEITEGFNGKPEEFSKAIIRLGKHNENNPSVENIFFDSSKFIAKYDKETALTLYIHYLYYDLKSSTFNNKPLTKTIQKSLFKNNEQLHEFEIIIDDFIKTRDLKSTLQKIPSIYISKRKRIHLNKEIIKEVQEQHSETVELLNEYLQDEYESEDLSIKSQDINNEEIKIEITSKKPVDFTKSNYVNEINLTSNQIDVLNFFSKSNLCISFEDFEAYAKEKNFLKNHVIDSINEIYYDTLDDILIEEEEEFYTILENYYQKITLS